MTATPDLITITALEAEKSLPPEVPPAAPPRSGPARICAVQLLDQDGNVVASMPISPVTPYGGDITFTFQGLTIA